MPWEEFQGNEVCIFLSPFYLIYIIFSLNVFFMFQKLAMGRFLFLKIECFDISLGKRSNCYPEKYR